MSVRLAGAVIICLIQHSQEYCISIICFVTLSNQCLGPTKLFYIESDLIWSMASVKPFGGGDSNTADCVILLVPTDAFKYRT